MEFLQTFLPILLYILGAVLLGVLIYLAIKLLDTADKLNVLLDDIEDKSQSLNGVFEAVENVGETINGVNFKVAGILSTVLGKWNSLKSKKKKRNEEEEDEDDYE